MSSSPPTPLGVTGTHSSPPNSSRAEPLGLPELLRAASRTFAIGIERLPGRLREAVQVSYLLLRVSDYLEDNEEMPAERKVELLTLWDQVLAGDREVAELEAQLNFSGELTPDALVAQRAGAVVDALRRLPEGYREPVTRYVRLSTQGMARWVGRGPQIRTEEELDDYMHQVAGLVGYLLTDLFSQRSLWIRRRRERLMPLAREFGLALQTVNVIRGLPNDLERGWIYVPESYVSEFGISREALFEPASRDIAVRVLDRLVAKAERHLDAALEYVEEIPAWHLRIRIFCVLPLLFAVRTLALSRSNERVFRAEVKMSRDEVTRLVRETVRWGWSNRWLKAMYHRLSA